MSDMNRAIIKMVGVMKKDYQRFWEAGSKGEPISGYAKDQLDNFHESIEIHTGKKYIKIVRDRSVWGFIVNTDTDKQFKYGDILKPAGWAAPARNKARGNVFTDLSWVNWTGPAYL